MHATVIHNLVSAIIRLRVIMNNTNNSKKKSYIILMGTITLNSTPSTPLTSPSHVKNRYNKKNMKRFPPFVLWCLTWLIDCWETEKREACNVIIKLNVTHRKSIILGLGAEKGYKKSEVIDEVAPPAFSIQLNCLFFHRFQCDLDLKVGLGPRAYNKY